MTGDLGLVTESMAGDHQTPAMSDPRDAGKTRRKRKHQNAIDTGAKRALATSPSYQTSVSSSSEDSSSNKTFLATPQNASPEPSTASGSVDRRYPVMGRNGYSFTPTIKQAVSSAQEVRLSLGDDLFLTVAL
ncbi:hypothetical protein Bbelb_264530 [Branchiostoma belcheri]|nr:hypothetical protein Bbelb_264530 [Branchiostoma belcheri]